MAVVCCGNITKNFFKSYFLAFTNKLYVEQDRETWASNERIFFGGKSWRWSIAEIYQTFTEETGERHIKPVT